MNSTQPMNIKQLSGLIKNLHNHEKFNLSEQFPSIVSSPLQQASLSVLNLQINESLDNLKHRFDKGQTYFERQNFIIGKRMKKIGQIVKILSSLCNFEDERQMHLASFDTVAFYHSLHKMWVLPHMYMNFFKGIFPQTNVDKENIPLYIPFYEKLDSYHSNIGNPNWQTSRENLEFISQNIIKNSQDNWYLLLAGSKKILEVYRKDSIEQVWAHMYYFYVNETLKPYRYISSKNDKDAENSLDKIVGIILAKLGASTDKNLSHLFCLILYVLTDKVNSLQDSFKIFTEQFKMYIANSSTDFESRKICSEWGLTNAMYCQLLHNNLDLMALSGFQDDSQFRKLDFMLIQSIELTEILTQKAIPFYDFYLRIAYSSHSKDIRNVERSHDQILSLLRNSLQKSEECFPFPQYGYWQKAILEPFSTNYLEKYPQKIVQIVKFLPKQTSIWKLLTCEKLNNFEQFQRISRQLEDKRNAFIEQIKRKVKISQTDYDEFIKVWREFHEITLPYNSEQNYESLLYKIENGRQKVFKIMNISMNILFQSLVYLPLSQSKNILRVTDSLIEGLESVLPWINQNQKQVILKLYLQILLDPKIKEKLIGGLNEEDAAEFWKKWSLVYMIDQNLVNELIDRNQPIQQQMMQNPRNHRMQEERKNPYLNNCVELMEDD